ncbi:MAG: DUF4912 domain-containing protein [Deltaproteobacteria bacterium]|nr:DUF4912 domain-containing protein [Deltaproteobacteria bacterium]
MAEKRRGKGGGAGKAPPRPPRAKNGARGLAAGRAPPPVRKAAARKGARPAAAAPAGREPSSPPAPAAQRGRKPKARPAAGSPPAPTGRRKAAARARPPLPRARGLAARPPSDEPDPDGYFVARIRGEEAVRDAPHPLTEAAVEAARGAPRERPPPRLLYDEALGELPWSYGDDALVALPRDPRTLFLYWDHAAGTAQRAWEGLDNGRAELWVFGSLPGGGWERVRVVSFAIEARSWYVHDLEPGRTYRAEIHLVDARRDRLLPAPSNAVDLPPAGPSPRVDDRFARIPWGEPLSGLLAAGPGRPFSDKLRAQLQRLSSWGDGVGPGPAGGRATSPLGPPGASPSSPWGGGRTP